MAQVRWNKQPWENHVRALVDLLGVNKPQNTRREEVAEALGLKLWQIDVITGPMREMGALAVEATAGKRRDDGMPTRKSTWTITADADTILAEAKKNGFVWGRSKGRQPNKLGDSRDYTTDGRAPAKLTPTLPRPFHDHSSSASEAARWTPADLRWTPADLGTSSTRSTDTDEPESPFAVLKPLKRDEQAALIEAARQYRGRKEFIDEEIERFAKHGLKLDPAAVGIPRDERLDHILLVLDYVTRLERENERLQNYAQEGMRNSGTEKELRQVIERQEKALEELVRQRADSAAEAGRLSNLWRGKEKTLRDQVDRLEQENLDLRRQINKLEGRPTISIEH
jgi:hypothetical protein